MAGMYTSSNQYPRPKAPAAQCNTNTTTATEMTAAAANGGTRRVVATSVAAVLTYGHDTVERWPYALTLRCGSRWIG
ncbi:MAG: hypothetical protein QOJ24_3600 [Mycobacterium sp.]|nr:hypothetical protein [Mycobacterium sp.]